MKRGRCRRAIIAFVVTVAAVGWLGPAKAGSIRPDVVLEYSGLSVTQRTVGCKSKS